MILIQRIGYYLGGFSIGLIILAFFLNGKKTSCSYGLDARVIKNINSKKIIYNDVFKKQMQSFNVDSTAINYILKKGDINFSKSKPRLKPCGIYHLNGYYRKKSISINIKNCDSIATIIDMFVK